jgi:serine/threonine protein kinase/Tol biopolymer transport system component
VVGQTILHYRIVRTLGSGGMGVVYEAEDLRLDRRVALKFLPPQLAGDPIALERFQREARAASALNHPNICTIHAIEQAETAEGVRHFLAMERLEGDSLDHHIAGRPLPLDLTLELGIQVADALDSAHSRGIVHRDIKPANIFVLARKQAKVLDFGLAKLASARIGMGETMTAAPGEALTSPGTAVGTVAYMSPEQARGEELDGRTDLFSFGAVLYEMCTGRPPFEGKTSAVIFQKILDKVPDPPRTLNPGIPPKLDEIVLKALEKDRDLRYQTAAELRADLKRLKRDTSGRTLMATPTESAYQQPSTTGSQLSSSAILVREASRHKVSLGIAAAILLALVAAAALGVYSLLPREAPTTATAPGRQMAIAPLTSAGNVSGCVAISPDGRHVVYCTEEGSDGALWVRQVATGATVKLTAIAGRTIGAGGSATFSPDGNFIYLRRAGEKVRGALYVLPALGGEPRQVLTHIQGPVALSPDGKRLAFVRSDPVGGETALIIANADGSGERKLHTGRVAENWVTPWGPSWSSDGKLIASGYQSREDGFETTPVVIDVETGTLRRLTDARWRQVFRVAWLHDRSALLFLALSRSEPNLQLWLAPYPTGEPRRITNDLNNYGRYSLAVTGDDSTIVSAQFSQVAQVWTTDAAGRNPKRVTTGSGADMVIGWTGAQRLLYRSRTPTPSLWMASLDSGAPRRVPIDLEGVVGVSIAPGQDWIAYNVRGGTGSSIWRVNLDGSRRLQLAQRGSDPAVTPDGAAVVYTWYEEGRPNVWKVPSAGGEPVRLIADAFNPLVSPDGRYILATVFDEANRARGGIFRVSDGTREQMLESFDRPGGDIAPQWAPDSRAVVFSRTESEISNLWAHPLDGSAPRQLTRFDSDRIWAFAFSPDGKQLAVSRGHATADVVLIRNFR